MIPDWDETTEDFEEYLANVVRYVMARQAEESDTPDAA